MAKTTAKQKQAMAAGTAPRITVKYQKGREHCPRCKGQISYSCTLKDRLLIGFGFAGSRFQIDAIERRGFGGECMDCLAPIFAVESRKHVTRFPKLGGRK